MGLRQLSRILRATARLLIRAVPVLLALADALMTRSPKPKPPQ